MRVVISDANDTRLDVLLVFLFSNEPDRSFPELSAQLPWLEAERGWRDFRAEKNELALFYGPENAAVCRVLAVGLGERDKFTLEVLRQAAGAALRKARDLRLKQAALWVGQLLALGQDGEAILEETVLGGLLGLYTFDAYRSKAPENQQLEELIVCRQGALPEALQAAVRRAEHTARGICLARNLSNTPANVLTPAAMEAEAKALAGRHGFKCRSLDEQALREQGLGAFVSVLQGSEVGGRLVLLEYAPDGLENQPPLALVGKGVTFDTGGISLKPAAGMHRMKSDMAGAAAVMGAMEIIGCEKVQRRVIGLLACAENMPDGKATRPGDVVTTLSGKTVEITNTDAEGRLVLCDSIAYAQKHFQPDCLVDIATLTGACVVALGEKTAGLFTEDAQIEEIGRSAGERLGEPFWPMPLWDSFFEAMKSDTADMVNAGAREGGAVNAALFLKQFVEPGVRWAHLDIAGPARLDKGSATCIPGSTGFGVRTLFDLARKL